MLTCNCFAMFEISTYRKNLLAPSPWSSGPAAWVPVTVNRDWMTGRPVALVHTHWQADTQAQAASWRPNLNPGRAWLRRSGSVCSSSELESGLHWYDTNIYIEPWHTCTYINIHAYTYRYSYRHALYVHIHTYTYIAWIVQSSKTCCSDVTHIYITNLFSDKHDWSAVGIPPWSSGWDATAIPRCQGIDSRKYHWRSLTCGKENIVDF